MATKNLTIRLSDQLIEASKEYAKKQGKSLNEMIREFLENKVSKPKKYETAVDKWVNFARENPASVKGYKFDRDDANER
jgi:predicted transcriptional regulator